MIKGLTIAIDSKGNPSVMSEGVPSVLIDEIRKCRNLKDFPKGVASLEVWTPDNGCIDRISKAKMEAQAKHNAAYAKSQKALKEES